MSHTKQGIHVRPVQDESPDPYESIYNDSVALLWAMCLFVTMLGCTPGFFFCEACLLTWLAGDREISIAFLLAIPLFWIFVWYTGIVAARRIHHSRQIARNLTWIGLAVAATSPVWLFCVALLAFILAHSIDT